MDELGCILEILDIMCLAGQLLELLRDEKKYINGKEKGRERYIIYIRIQFTKGEEWAERDRERCCI